MLHVDGRDDVDPRVEDLVDVLVALLVSHARRIRVRELVDQRELRRAPDHGVDVHLVELERRRAAARRCGTTSRPSACAGGLGPVVRLEVADHDVAALLLRLPALLEHAVRLPDAGRHAEQDAVAAAHRRASSLRAEQVVHDQVDQLDADERKDDAAEPVDQRGCGAAAPSRRSRGTSRRGARAGRARG